MRTTQTILRHRLQVSTTAPTKPRVVVKPAVPTMIAVAPTAVPALAAVNGGWRKQRPAQPKPAKEPKPRAASADEKLQLQSLLIMIRSAMNWSQEELAVRLGVNYQTTGTWERGRSYPAPPMYDKIVALGKETGVLPK
jgi:DNA-binding XRE family transcriptional regulator